MVVHTNSHVYIHVLLSHINLRGPSPNLAVVKAKSYTEDIDDKTPPCNNETQAPHRVHIFFWIA